MCGEWFCDGGSVCSWDIYGYEEIYKVCCIVVLKWCEWLLCFDVLEVF